jgi:hypothetical protein
LIEHQHRIADAFGIYAWLFERRPPGVPAIETNRLHGMPCLYIGTANRQTLRRRLIKNHCRGSARSSTLRKSIRALLSEKAGALVDEETARDWMSRHAVVCPIDMRDPANVEDALLLGPDIFPLNIQGHRHSPFAAPLSALRTKWLPRAR